MTYARFLAVFLGLPIGLSLVLLRRSRRGRWGPLAVLLTVVYAATTPWDNGAVARGLWDFDDARTWGVRLGYLPLEEYLFFGLQTVLTGLWVRHRLAKRAPEARSQGDAEASSPDAPASGAVR